MITGVGARVWHGGRHGVLLGRGRGSREGQVFSGDGKTGGGGREFAGRMTR